MFTVDVKQQSNNNISCFKDRNLKCKKSVKYTNGRDQARGPNEGEVFLILERSFNPCLYNLYILTSMHVMPP